VSALSNAAAEKMRMPVRVESLISLHSRFYRS
jgi:hypothetical protein